MLPHVIQLTELHAAAMRIFWPQIMENLCRPRFEEQPLPLSKWIRSPMWNNPVFLNLR